jgi:[NiFe] hydrogenase diaphorase moiety small subunit
MSGRITLTIDGREIEAAAGQTIMEAADESGVYIPRLCWMRELSPAGSCRVCTVRVNGRAQAACTQPVAPGLIVENDTEQLRAMRSDVIDMLFVEGNHFCMFCEKSGECELQALAYRFGITAPKFPFIFPKRELDASHPDVFVDRNRCVLCARCVRASAELDGKHALGFDGRGMARHIAPSARDGLGDTELTGDDHAARACPTGAIVRRNTAFRIPVGARRFDHEVIGGDIEQRSSQE